MMLGDRSRKSALAQRIETTELEAFQKTLPAKRHPYARPGIEETPWGSRDRSIRDPFGNRLTFTETVNSAGRKPRHTTKNIPAVTAASSELVMTFRPATPDDAALLRRWDKQPHIVAAKADDDWAWEMELHKSPDWREQLIAEVDGRPVGFLEIIDPAREESHYWGAVPPDLRAIDVWIGDEADLGKGYGTKMMRLALGRCFADPTVTAVLVDPLASNTRSHRFYERLGFRFVQRRRFGRDDCFVYRLHRTDYSPAP